MLYHEIQKTVKQNFAFTVLESLDVNKFKIISRNNINTNMTFEIISPNLKNIEYVKISEMINEKGEKISSQPSPMSIVTVSFDKVLPLAKNDIGRIYEK
jgi:hypothetical protein